MFLTTKFNIQVEKNVFLVFYSGERAKYKILKICEAFGANRYPFTEDLRKQVQAINEVGTTLVLGLSVLLARRLLFAQASNHKLCWFGRVYGTFVCFAHSNMSIALPQCLVWFVFVMLSSLFASADIAH